MTDRELLELAAKAAGIEIVGDVDRMVCQPDHKSGGYVIRTDSGGDSCWNPLTDDGDAFRLAVKLDLHVHPSGDEVWVSNPATSLAEDVVFETYRGDPYAATRRAIVRAAAEIGRNM